MAGQHAAGLVHGHRVIGAHLGAAAREFGDGRQAGRFAHVIGVGLEGQAPQGDLAAAQVFAKARHQLFSQAELLRVVRGLGGLDDAHRQAVLGRGVDQRLHVLRKARAAIARARVQEVIADARVRANAAAHLFNVGAQHFGQVRHFVHERNARGQHGIGGVLGQFGRAHVHHHQAVVGALEGFIDAAHDADRVVVVRADDHAVRTHEVVDGRAFLQEFRIGRHRERDVDAALGQFLGDHGAHLVGRADGHRGLVHDQLARGHVARDVLRGGQHVLEIGGTVFAGRGAHGDELDVAERNALRDVIGEMQAPGLHVAAHQVFKARLVNGNAALAQQRDLGRIHVQAHDIVAHVRQARSRHQSYVTGTHDRDLHACAPSK